MKIIQSSFFSKPASQAPPVSANAGRPRFVDHCYFDICKETVYTDSYDCSHLEKNI